MAAPGGFTLPHPPRDRRAFPTPSGRAVFTVNLLRGIEVPPGKLVLQSVGAAEIRDAAVAGGMLTLRMDGWLKVMKGITTLEQVIRDYCARCLDPLVGSDGFDFIADLGAQMPMRVISRLLGIPEEAQEAARDRANAHLTTEAGAPMEIASSGFDDGTFFSEYIDWRAKNPSNDIITELLNVEFTDETGVTRRLERAELQMYVSMVSAAGNETTTRLISWMAKVLAEHHHASARGPFAPPAREPAAQPFL